MGRAKPFVDAQLGELRRSRGAWRGSVRLAPNDPIPLSVPGSRSEPDHAALELARTIPAEYERGRGAVEAALDEHRTAALEGVGAEGLVYPAPTSASVIELDRTLTIQLAYEVDWDDDHTLGACLRGGELVELNGSILEP